MKTRLSLYGFGLLTITLMAIGARAQSMKSAVGTNAGYGVKTAGKAAKNQTSKYKQVPDHCAVKPVFDGSQVNRVIEEIKSKNRKCFDPLKDPDIQRFYRPNVISPSETCNLHETEAKMKSMHQYIRTQSKKYGMDPRIAYIRMLGESQGNPYAQYGTSQKKKCLPPKSVKTDEKKAFGLFQFLGRGYKQPKYYAQEVMEKVKENELKPAATQKGIRQVQVEYYFQNYVASYAKTAPYTKCKKPFAEFSNLQKLAYLGRGHCQQLEQTKSTIMNNQSYISSGAKRIYQDMQNGVPLCGEKP